LEGPCWLNLNVECSIRPLIRVSRLGRLRILVTNARCRGGNATREAIGNIGERLIAATLFLIFANHD
jgi:hypothetical protein